MSFFVTWQLRPSSVSARSPAAGEDGQSNEPIRAAVLARLNHGVELRVVIGSRPSSSSLPPGTKLGTRLGSLNGCTGSRHAGEGILSIGQALQDAEKAGGALGAFAFYGFLRAISCRENRDASPA